MKAIFLDIDGVLITNRSLAASTGKGISLSNQVDSLCVKEFNRIIDQTRAEIIISSTWRRYWNDPLDAMLEFHLANIRGAITAFTPVLETGRGTETEFCITPDMRYAILDDEIHDIRFPVFQTSMEFGLTREIADSVITHLNTEE